MMSFPLSSGVTFSDERLHVPIQAKRKADAASLHSAPDAPPVKIHSVRDDAASWAARSALGIQVCVALYAVRGSVV